MLVTGAYALQVLQQQQQVEEVMKQIMQVEPMRNDVLIKYLKGEYGEHLEIKGNEAKSGKIFYSRFHRSKEDFYMKCKQSNAADIKALCVMEIDELEMDTGDCKDVSKDNDKYQVMAYMTRAAADVALSAANQCRLFKRMIKKCTTGTTK